MSTQADQDFAAWLAFHKPQLDSINLPEPLHRTLWRKLKFEELDISSVCKIILDEESEKVNLMANKDIKKDSDVYLIDHAWTFRYEDASQTLLANEALLARLEKLTEYSEKQEIPEAETVKGKRDAQVVFKQQLEKGGRVFDLDGLEIEKLGEFAWPDTLEELSIVDNLVYNPKCIADHIVPLPNIKAMWFQFNPVAEQCSNFSSIAESMPTL